VEESKASVGNYTVPSTEDLEDTEDAELDPKAAKKARKEEVNLANKERDEILESLSVIFVKIFKNKLLLSCMFSINCL